MFSRDFLALLPEYDTASLFMVSCLNCLCCCRAELLIGVENGRKDMGTGPANIRYLKSCVPESEAGRVMSARMSITNNGALYGTYAGQMLYLREMVSWYARDGGRMIEVHAADGKVIDAVPIDAHACIDQGLQNYLIFTGAMDRLFLRAFLAGTVSSGIGYLFDETGPVRTLFLGEPFVCGKYDSRGVLSGVVDGRIVNSKGQIASVVHLWDRRCTATLQNAWLLGSHKVASTAQAAFNATPPFPRPRNKLDVPAVPIQCP